MGMDTREAADYLGISVRTVRYEATRLGLGRNNGYGYWFSDADIETLRTWPGRIVPHTKQPHCPRCEILTPNGELCEECRFELAHGHFAVVDELTGVVA